MWPRLSNRYTCKSNYKVKPEPFYCTPKFGRNHNLILNMGLYLLIAKREFSLPYLVHIISYTDSKREVRLKIIERIAIFFWPFGPKFGLKIRGAGGVPPLDPPLQPLLFFSSPPFLLLALSFSPFLFLHCSDFGANRT